GSARLPHPFFVPTRRERVCSSSPQPERLVSQGTLLLDHLVVLENDRHRVFALTINVGRLFEDDEVLVVEFGRRSKNRFDLFLRHSLGYFIYVRFGNAAPDAIAQCQRKDHHQEKAEAMTKEE